MFFFPIWTPKLGLSIVLPKVLGSSYSQQYLTSCTPQWLTPQISPKITVVLQSCLLIIICHNHLYMSSSKKNHLSSQSIPKIWRSTWWTIHSIREKMMINLINFNNFLGVFRPQRMAPAAQRPRPHWAPGSHVRAATGSQVVFWPRKTSGFTWRLWLYSGFKWPVDI